MSLPTSDCNIVGARLYPVADLSLVSTAANATPVTSPAFSTGIPATLVVMGRLSSGTCTVNIRIDDTAADAVTNAGTATATLVLSSTGVKYYQTVATTADYTANTSNLWVVLQQVGGNSGFIFTELVVTCLYEMKGGEDWYSVRAGGFNAAAGRVGVGATGGPHGQSLTEVLGTSDGSGTMTMTDF